MRVVVNGRVRDIATQTTLGRLIDAEAADRRGVAAALDGEVVPRSDWDATPLDDGAEVEIVGAVQGG